MSTAVMSTAIMSTSALGSSVRGSSHLRLTKRGRRVLLFLIVAPLAASALVFALNGGMAVATNASGAGSLQYVTVESGQSLWQLASQIAPSADPREVISDVVRLNQLDSTDLQAGQRLAIPVQYSH